MFYPCAFHKIQKNIGKTEDDCLLPPTKCVLLPSFGVKAIVCKQHYDYMQKHGTIYGDVLVESNI